MTSSSSGICSHIDWRPSLLNTPKYFFIDLPLLKGEDFHKGFSDESAFGMISFPKSVKRGSPSFGFGGCEELPDDVPFGTMESTRRQIVIITSSTISAIIVKVTQ
jgi:hypothetical protein